jgi:predicted methyltransferase
MNTTRLTAAALALASLSGPTMLVAKPASSPIAVAVADPARPAEDTARDAARKPAKMLAFAGIKPGMTVGELLPGGGYFTRVFAKAVGPEGAVFAWMPAGAPPRFTDKFKPVTDNPAYGNVTLLLQESFAPPRPVDVVWTSQNYHDLHLRGGNAEAANTAAFKALKPGGVYIVVDHVARAGSGTTDTDTLHRIDPEAVKAEVTKAGFVFDAEDASLRNTTDDHTRKVYDLHDQTDQFAFRFRKPR